MVAHEGGHQRVAQGWQHYGLGGRTLEARLQDGEWTLRLGERETTSPHVDRAFQQLLNVPSHSALQLGLALLNADPGDELESRP